MFWKKKRKQEQARHPRITDSAEGQAFRRSYTLTGSASSSVEAASAGRAQIKSDRLREHELRSHRNRLALRLGVTLIVLGALYALLQQFVWQISAFSVPSDMTKPIDRSAYQQVVTDYYQTRPFERFRFALDEDGLTRHIRRTLPEVSSVSIRPNGFMGGELVLELRKPLLVWRIGTESYFVDGKGAAFRTNHFSTPRLTVKDTSGIDPSDNILASDRTLRFIGRTVSLVEASGVGRISEVVVPPNKTREIDFRLEGRGFVIKAQLDRDPASQAQDIIAAVRHFAPRPDPEYIDVRVPAKAYYR